MWTLGQQVGKEELLNHTQWNDHMGEGTAHQHARPHHCTLLVQNEVGLKVFYRLISYSHIDYFYRVPRIPRSLLEKRREGLLVGSACGQGEVFETMMQKSSEEAEKAAAFYDYIKVQQLANYIGLIDRGLVQN